MPTKKILFFILLASILSIILYFIPFIRQNSPLFLILITALASIVTILSLRDTTSPFQFIKPVIANSIFFIPLIIAEWIHLGPKGTTTIYGNSIGVYQHYSFIPLLALMLTITFGIIGAYYSLMTRKK